MKFKEAIQHKARPMLVLAEGTAWYSGMVYSLVILQDTTPNIDYWEARLYGKTKIHLSGTITDVVYQWSKLNANVVMDTNKSNITEDIILNGF